MLKNPPNMLKNPPNMLKNHPNMLKNHVGIVEVHHYQFYLFLIDLNFQMKSEGISIMCLDKRFQGILGVKHLFKTYLLDLSILSIQFYLFEKVLP